MGDGVTSDNELVVRIGGQSAGSTAGQLILDDVEYNKTRDNEEKHGIGNAEPQGIRYGNRTYSVSATGIANQSTAGMLNEARDDNIITGVLRTPNKTISFGKLDWNDVTVEATDDGDVTVSVDFNAREVSE